MKMPSIKLPKFGKQSAGAEGSGPVVATEPKPQATQPTKVTKPKLKEAIPRKFGGVEVAGTKAFVKEGWLWWVFDGPSYNSVCAAIHARFGEEGLFACSRGYLRPDGSFFVTIWKLALKAAPKQMQRQQRADAREAERESSQAAAAAAKAAKKRAAAQAKVSGAAVSVSE